MRSSSITTPGLAHLAMLLATLSPGAAREIGPAQTAPDDSPARAQLDADPDDWADQDLVTFVGEPTSCRVWEGTEPYQYVRMYAPASSSASFQIDATMPKNAVAGDLIQAVIEVQVGYPADDDWDNDDRKRAVDKRETTPTNDQLCSLDILIDNIPVDLGAKLLPSPDEGQVLKTRAYYTYDGVTKHPTILVSQNCPSPASVFLMRHIYLQRHLVATTTTTTAKTTNAATVPTTTTTVSLTGTTTSASVTATGTETNGNSGLGDCDASGHRNTDTGTEIGTTTTTSAENLGTENPAADNTVTGNTTTGNTAAENTATGTATGPEASQTNPLGNYRYKGGFATKDNYPTFALEETDREMTYEICTSKCSALRKPYAGIHRQDCYCGTKIDTLVTQGPVQCGIACPGNPKEHCGGDITSSSPLGRRQAPPPITAILSILEDVDLVDSNANTPAPTTVTPPAQTAHQTFTRIIAGLDTTITRVQEVKPTGDVQVCYAGHCFDLNSAFFLQPFDGDDCPGELVYLHDEGCGCFKPLKCDTECCKGKQVYKPTVCAGGGCGGYPEVRPEACSCEGGFQYKHKTPGSLGSPGSPGTKYPGTPGTPGTPGKFVVPGCPGGPNCTVSHVVHGTPSTPGMPDTPGKPGVQCPGGPNCPSTPETPSKPGTPGSPISQCPGGPNCPGSKVSTPPPAVAGADRSFVDKTALGMAAAMLFALF